MKIIYPLPKLKNEIQNLYNKYDIFFIVNVIVDFISKVNVIFRHPIAIPTNLQKLHSY